MARGKDGEPETAQSLYNEMLKEHIYPFLRLFGYRRSGQTFAKYQDGYEAFLGFQKSRTNTKSDVSFTVNVTARHKNAHEQLRAASRDGQDRWGRNFVVLPTYEAFGLRIGELMPERKDFWWEFRDRPGMELVARQVGDAIRDYAIPAIDRVLSQGPRPDPSFVVETYGNPSGLYVNDNGVPAYRNVGGKRLWPTPQP